MTTIFTSDQQTFESEGDSCFPPSQKRASSIEIVEDEVDHSEKEERIKEEQKHNRASANSRPNRNRNAPPLASDMMFQLGKTLFAEAGNWMKKKAPRTVATIQQTLEDWHDEVGSPDGSDGSDDHALDPLSIRQICNTLEHQTLSRLKESGLQWVHTLHTELKESTESPPIPNSRKRAKNQ